MQNKKSISVIIPNYNGRALLPQILPPLYNALYRSGAAFEIIIVDDHSTDDSIAYINEHFPAIRLLANEKNEGFSPTINKGIFAAQNELLLLLNSDVKLEENYFENLFSYFDREDTFGVMGRIINWEDNNIQDGGKYPSFHGVKIKTSGNYIPEDPKNTQPLYSMYLSGANAFVCREKTLKLSGFDEIYAPFYVEDFDMSLRAWRLGWKCYYEHNAICRHQTSTTIKLKSRKNFVKKIYYRNKMFLHAIHLTKGKLFLWYIQLFVEAMLHLITGRLWFFLSLKMFFLSQVEITKSKRDFKAVAAAASIKIEGVNEVVNKIVLSLKNKKIKII